MLVEANFISLVQNLVRYKAYEDCQRRKEVWYFNLFQAVMFLCSSNVKLAICCFCGESPRWFITRSYVYTRHNVLVDILEFERVFL